MAASSGVECAAASADADPLRRRLLDAIAALGRRWRLIVGMRGALEALAAAGSVAAALVAIAGRDSLAALMPGAGIAAALLIIACGLLRACGRLSPLDLALSVERAFPFVQDRVATAVDVAGRGAAGTLTGAIVRRLLEEATGALETLPLRRALPLRGLRRTAVAATTSLALLACAWAMRPETVTATDGHRALAPPLSRPPAVAAAPQLFDISITIFPPAYSGLPPRSGRPEDRRLFALYGSRVTVAANVEPNELALQLRMNPGRPLPMSAEASGRRSVSFPLRERVTCYLEGTIGDTVARSAQWTLQPQADSAPVVHLTSPSGDVTLEVAGPVPVSVTASDDFLVSAVGLHCRLEGEQQWRSLPLQVRPGAMVSAGAQLNPTAFGLVAGRALVLRAWATDNDTVSGPKTAISAMVTIRLGGGEVGDSGRSATAQAERQQADAFAQLQEAAAELEREVSSALQRLEQGAGPTEIAQMSTRLQEAAQRLAQQASQVEAAMAQLEARMTLEELVTPELAEKVRQLHQLMREVLDEDLRRALEELQRALEQTDLGRLEMSLEQVREAQRQFLARLDQTLELLRRASLEAELARLRRLAEELARRQAELRQQTDALARDSNASTRAAEQDQRRLARDTEPLAEQVAAGADSARAVSVELGRDLDALARELLRRDPAGEMREAAGALGRGRPSAAAEPQGRALEALQLAASRLAEAERAVSQDMRAELTHALGELLRDTLRLSQSQEDAELATGRLEAVGTRDLLHAKTLVGPLRQQQAMLARAVTRLAERMDDLARRTPMMDPTLGREVAAVAEDMMQAAREIEGAQLALARSRQQEAVGRLNEAARRLLDLSAAMGGASAQSMLSEYMKRLQQLAERQRGLNEQTGQAGQQGRQAGQGAGMSLAQLAFEQAMIRAALEQLVRGMRGTNDQVADQLGGVPAEMEKVEGDLRSGRVERQTLQRQGQILQKMLEAQRSLYTRQPQERERRAERPRPYAPPPPPPALAPDPSRPPNLRLSPQPARPRLPEGYEDMVQAYFERLGAAR